MLQANILVATSIGLLTGVLLASFFAPLYSLMLAVFLVVPFVLIGARNKRYILYAILVLLFAVFGVMRFQGEAAGILNKDIALDEGPVTFEAVIVETPDVRTNKTFLSLRATDETIDGGIRISTNNITQYQYGEYLYIEGALAAPENFDGFDYRGYLAKEGIGYVMYNPRIERLGEYERSLSSFLSNIKTNFRGGLTRSLLPPHSSLYAAMMLGDKGALTSQQKEALQGAGLSHIVAISGMHIMIILFAVLALALALGLWRAHAIYFALFLVVAYIIMIGAPASAVRAGIMGGGLLTAQLVGRPNFSWRVLLLAAAVMVAFNPLLVRYDVGFQLSFLAVIGILLLSHRIEYYIWKVPALIAPFRITRDRKLWDQIERNKAFGVRGLLAMTFSAQAFTFPLILYHFGTFSPWSPLSNLLVLPILPYALAAGFIASLGGMVGGVVALVAAAPAWVLSGYIWGVAGLFS